jgi:hypothetical protein
MSDRTFLTPLLDVLGDGPAGPSMIRQQVPEVRHRIAIDLRTQLRLLVRLLHD